MAPDERKAEIDMLKDSPELDRLYDDIRTEVSRDLRHFRAREEQLSAMAPDELLIMYMNWKFRQIQALPTCQTIIMMIRSSCSSKIKPPVRDAVRRRVRGDRSSRSMEGVRGAGSARVVNRQAMFTRLLKAARPTKSPRLLIDPVMN